MSSYKVYFISGSPPCWRVMLAMAVKGLDYTPVRFDNARKEQKNEAFLKINPQGTVPVLEGDGIAVRNSLAILAYLDEAHPEPPLFGSSAAETGAIWQQIMEFEGHYPDAIQSITRPIFRGKAQEQADAIREGVEGVRPCLEALEKTMASSDYLCGGAVSAADIVIYPNIMQLMRGAQKPDAETLELRLTPLGEHYPAVAAWAARIAALPRYDDAYPPHWKQAAE